MKKTKTVAALTVDAATASQAKRRRLLGDLIDKAIRSYVKRHEGRTILDSADRHDIRLTLWIARSLLITTPARRALANKLIADAPFNHACHFSGVASMVLLTRYGKLLTPAAKASLENFVLRYLADWMTEDFTFHGANDNAPLGCNALVSLAGDYFKRPALTEFARERFRKLDRLLDLRGYIHECNSPTYSAASLVTLADLVEATQDEELRTMALRAEQRVWQEVFLHFHPGVRHQIGPYSRGYPDDNANQCTMVMLVMYAACGAISPFNPVAMLFPPTPGSFAHNIWFFQWASTAFCAAPTFHVPVELANRCLQRPTPFTVLGSNEFMPIGTTPCGQTTVQAYGEREWALSSFGSRLWAGQTVPLHALYQRHPVRAGVDTREQLAAIRSVYTRYHASDVFASMGLRDAKRADNEIKSDHAAAFVVQHAGTALLGYVPVAGTEKVRTMKASVVFPLHHNRPDEIWHGDRQVAGFSASFPEFEWVFVRDGDIYLAFYPLIAKQQDAMLCSQQYVDYGEYGMITFYNMSGFEERVLSAKERRYFGSGMVMEISSQRQAGTFEKFRDRMRAGKIKQRIYGPQRDLLYTRPGVELELIYDCEQLNLRRAAVNGRLVSNAVKLETTPRLPLVK